MLLLRIHCTKEQPTDGYMKGTNLVESVSLIFCIFLITCNIVLPLLICNMMREKWKWAAKPKFWFMLCNEHFRINQFHTLYTISFHTPIYSLYTIYVLSYVHCSCVHSCIYIFIHRTQYEVNSLNWLTPHLSQHFGLISLQFVHRIPYLRCYRRIKNNFII